MQKQEMSPRLTQFYRELLEWFDDGMTGYKFNSRTGICYNLYLWSYDPYEFRMLADELRNQFSSEGLNDQYPFNSGDDQYALEGSEYKTYQNEKRLAWIREHAK